MILCLIDGVLVGACLILVGVVTSALDFVNCHSGGEDLYCFCSFLDLAVVD